MTNVRPWTFALVTAFVFYGGTARAQETGPLEKFGTDGRLFSSGQDDYFLLSKQSYVSEDSAGYSGQVRIVKKYEGGGYEIKLKNFSARCRAPFDNIVAIYWSEPGNEDAPDPVEIKNPNRFPGAAVKDSYNLYWAACYGQFRKFK
jgi:hypothetical protein